MPRPSLIPFIDSQVTPEYALVLTISDTSNNWGTEGRLVTAHRLLEDFTEGNGWNVGGAPGATARV